MLRAHGLAAAMRSLIVSVAACFADGLAAAKYPAYGNLDAMQEWSGDPIAAQRDPYPGDP
jgi:hypothetical protein